MTGTCSDGSGSSTSTVYAKYLLLLPADKVAVIVMHKMMGLLMSSKDGTGSVRVVQAAHCIGEAVEREVSVSCLFDAILGGLKQY